MRPLGRGSIACTVLALAMVTSPVSAQGTLRVIQRMPSDSATPGTEIGVMFDRPVAGSPDRPVDPGPIMRVEPTILGTVSWRDPVTLRFTPAEPLRPGTTITVTVDTTFTAMDGARLARPYRFTARIPGPRPFGRRSGATRWEPSLTVRPRMAVLYTVPVDLDALRPLSRIEFDSTCTVRTVRLVPTVVRPMRHDEYWTYTATYVARATTAGRFVLPPAHAELMYDRAVQGRSSGGIMVITETPR